MMMISAIFLAPQCAIYWYHILYFIRIYFIFYLNIIHSNKQTNTPNIPYLQISQHLSVWPVTVTIKTLLSRIIKLRLVNEYNSHASHRWVWRCVQQICRLGTKWKDFKSNAAWFCTLLNMILRICEFGLPLYLQVLATHKFSNYK